MVNSLKQAKSIAINVSVNNLERVPPGTQIWEDSSLYTSSITNTRDDHIVWKSIFTYIKKYVID